MLHSDSEKSLESYASLKEGRLLLSESGDQPGIGYNGWYGPKAVALLNKSIGDKIVSEDVSKGAPEEPEGEGAVNDPATEEDASDSAPSGPKFTEAPGDPLAGIKRGASTVMASMEGKTVSMKVYVGTILGVVILMLLARCGG